MARYVLARLAALVGIVFIITVFCFLLVHLLPGDPAASILGSSYSHAAALRIDAEFGFNKPLPLQYLTWITGVLHGNLGKSLTAGPVTTLISQGFKTDVELVIYSQILSILIAVPLSVYASRRPGGKLDQTVDVRHVRLLLPARLHPRHLARGAALHPLRDLPGTRRVRVPERVGLLRRTLWQNLQVMFLPVAHPRDRHDRPVLPAPAQRDGLHAPGGVHHGRALEGADEQPDPLAPRPATLVGHAPHLHGQQRSPSCSRASSSSR